MLWCVCLCIDEEESRPQTQWRRSRSRVGAPGEDEGEEQADSSKHKQLAAAPQPAAHMERAMRHQATMSPGMKRSRSRKYPAPAPQEGGEDSLKGVRLLESSTPHMSPSTLESMLESRHVLDSRI